MPNIHESVWLAPGAQVYGDVEIAEDASLWPYAVIRAEAQRVRIARMTNIQDFVMIHVGYDAPTQIGEFCSIAHHATVHGARIGDHCLIGVGAIVMDGAEIGAGSIVAGGAVVPEGKHFAPHSVLAGVPAKCIASKNSARANRLNAWNYHRNAAAYRAGRHRAWDGEAYRSWLEAKRRDIESDADL